MIVKWRMIRSTLVSDAQNFMGYVNGMMFWNVFDCVLG